MTKFGELKIKILHNLTEAYIAGDKKRIKDILNILKENSDFKELYLFYEEIENIYLDDKDLAKLYVENVEKLLKDKMKKVSKYCKQIDDKFKGDNLTEVEVYRSLDILMEDDSLKNIDKKILGKRKLVEHLTTKREIVESENVYTNNEHLLHFVLAEKFNNNFEKMLNEEEKLKLSGILKMSSADLVNEFTILKEDISDKIANLILEEKDIELKNKLDDALREANKLPITKYNYYKLEQLKNGL